jgi:hypothetical protein
MNQIASLSLLERETHIHLPIQIRNIQLALSHLSKNFTLLASKMDAIDKRESVLSPNHTASFSS